MTRPPAEVEVLEQPPGASRRAWSVVVALVLALVVAGLEDRRAHAAAAARVEECAAAVDAARALADGRVSAMASYVRPAYTGRQTPETRAGLARLVGGAAREAAPGLDAARARCTRIDVRPWHGELRGRLDACVDTLDARLRWLQEVADDGGVAFRSAPDRVLGCVT